MDCGTVAPQTVARIASAPLGTLQARSRPQRAAQAKGTPVQGVPPRIRPYESPQQSVQGWMVAGRVAGVSGGGVTGAVGETPWGVASVASATRSSSG